MSPEAVVRETLPTLNVAVECLSKAAEKEAFLKELRTAIEEAFGRGHRALHFSAGISICVR